MPIRIVPDDPNKGKKKKQTTRRKTVRRNTGGGGGFPNIGGGGGGLGGLAGGLGALLPMLMKKPKILIVVAIIGVVIYFMGGGCNTTQLPVGPNTSDTNQLITNPDDYVENNQNKSLIDKLFNIGGADMDEEVYDEAEVFEPLADNAKNPLPERVSLEKYCPTRRNQGSQGSCVGWASSYAGRTILYARETGENPNNVAFSPAYLYNQIALRGCQGSYIVRAMENMQYKGALSYKDFGYNERNCTKQPTSQQSRKASNYTIKGFNRLTKGGSNYKTDLLAIKQHLAQGSPVVIGMMVGGSFMQSMTGKEAWVPTGTDRKMRGFGGHAMCVIGYDDYKFGDQGGFQIMNSWGEEWGKRGIFWISYSNFDFFTREAYGLYPMGDANAVHTSRLAAVFGLVNNDTRQNIAFTHMGGNTFRTVTTIAKGTKFKIEVTNKKECYTYVLGEETDGSSYVLFPYTEKHSPYCGITGTRLFPKDHSLQADKLGTIDKMAIVVTEEPIDYNVLKQAINRSSANSFDRKLQDALRNDLISGAQFRTTRDGIFFDGDIRNGNAMFAVLEIEKR